MIYNRPVKMGGEFGRMANLGNAILIIGFGIMTWRTGILRKFEEHRKWAIRTFIVVSGVWFFRIGFGTWFLLSGFTAPGVAEDLTGCFDKFLYVGSYLVPLIVAEAYLRTKASTSPSQKKVMAIFLYLLIPLLIGGTLVTVKVFWLA